MKYLLMGTSSNFGNVLSMAVASVVIPFLPMLPTQVLLNNFLYDPLTTDDSYRQRRYQVLPKAPTMGHLGNSPLHDYDRSNQFYF